MTLKGDPEWWHYSWLRGCWSILEQELVREPQGINSRGLVGGVIIWCFGLSWVRGESCQMWIVFTISSLLFNIYFMLPLKKMFQIYFLVFWKIAIFIAHLLLKIMDDFFIVWLSLKGSTFVRFRVNADWITKTTPLKVFIWGQLLILNTIFSEIFIYLLIWSRLSFLI